MEAMHALWLTFRDMRIQCIFFVFLEQRILNTNFPPILVSLISLLGDLPHLEKRNFIERNCFGFYTTSVIFTVLFSYYPHIILILFSYSHIILILFSYYPHITLILSSYYSHIILILSSYYPHIILIFSYYSHIILE